MIRNLCAIRDVRVIVMLGWMVVHAFESGGVHADWPQWRGPDRNGLVERSPELISAVAGQSPLWRNETITSGEQGGRGSLVVAGERIYGLTGVAKSKGRTELFCLDIDRGETLWRSELPDSTAKETSSSTPCVVDDRVYVAGSSRVFCLGADDGALIWQREIKRKLTKPIASSIAVVENVVVLLADALSGLDSETGELLWQQFEIDGYESSPAVWDGGEAAMLICNTQLHTHGIDVRSGRVVWSVPGGGKSTPVIAREYGGDFLVNMSGSRKNGLTAYRLTGAGDPQPIWTKRVYDRAASPVVFDAHVYAIAGGSNGHGARVVCVHLDTGQEAWEETIDFAEVSSPLVADGKLVAVCGRMLWLIQATPEKFSVLSRANMQISLCTSPALVDGMLLLRESSGISCYDLRATP